MSATVEEVRISLPHTELAAHIYGPEDGLPVIALHGWLDNAASFARLAPKLIGLRIVALDFAGHGHSDHRPAGTSYDIWDYVYDVLAVADQMGWQRFSLLGHSMGAIVSVLMAGALPERIERLALIDGLVPFTGEADEAPERMGKALRDLMAVGNKRKPVYREFDRAVEARMTGMIGVSREAAELLAQRGLMPVPGGYTWRTDSRLMLPSVMRLTQAHARAFISRVQCPAHLIIAESGSLSRHETVLEWLDAAYFTVTTLSGGHHLHVDDEAGAQRVADCFKGFLHPS